jgi:hypothetical protein
MLTKVILSSLLVNFGKDILIKKSEKVLTIKKVVGGIGLNGLGLADVGGFEIQMFKLLTNVK